MKKQWKILVLALLSLLLVCTCMSAMADDGDKCPNYGSHVFVERITKAATCTEAGKKEYSCDCGVVQSIETIPALGHSYGEWGTKKEATCTEEGILERECTRCDSSTTGHWEQKPIAKKDHVWNVKVEAKAPTCTEDGWTACLRCGNCGNLNSDYKVLKALGHTKGAVTSHKDSTCVENGYDEYRCTVCRELVKVELPKTGHKFDDEHVTVTVNPTCTETGVGIRYCSVCNRYEDTNCVVPALGHDLKCTWAKEATCTEEGGLVMSCTRCKYEEKTTTPALGHDLKDKVTTEPSCTRDGVKTVYCARCSYREYNVKVPATGHKGKWVTVVEPTPKEPGLAKEICEVCGEEVDRKEVPYTEMRYNQTLCSFGPTTRELIGGTDWYRVTPIDLTVEGTFQYDLVAANKHVVGTVTVVIADGSLTVTYQLNAKQIKVTSESLTFYADLNALRTPTATTAPAFGFGAPIDIATAFGEDHVVLMSVFLKADYNQIGAGVYDLKEDAAAIADMTAIID